MGARAAGRRTRWVAAAALVAAVLVPWAAEAVPASGCETSPDKCYAFTMSTSPAQPQPGQEAVYTGSLSNLSKGGSGVQLGSANVTWSPSDAFWSVQPGTVSPRGTIGLVDGVLQLRDLSAAPGTTVTFTFRAIALRAQQVTFLSTAKQANRYSGTGNDLVQVGAAPTTSVSGSCDGAIPFDAYGCAAVEKAKGGEVCTGQTNDGGLPSAVTSCFRLKGIAGATGLQLVALRTYLGGDACPVVPLECSYVVQLLRKLDDDYTAADSAALRIDCGETCPALPVYFQEDEGRQIKEPLLPCLPVGPVTSPLSGSLACFTDNGDGTVDVPHVTNVNDWKVMG